MLALLLLAACFSDEQNVWIAQYCSTATPETWGAPTEKCDLAVRVLDRARDEDRLRMCRFNGQAAICEFGDSESEHPGKWEVFVYDDGEYVIDPNLPREMANVALITPGATQTWAEAFGDT